MPIYSGGYLLERQVDNVSTRLLDPKGVEQGIVISVWPEFCKEFVTKRGFPLKAQQGQPPNAIWNYGPFYKSNVQTGLDSCLHETKLGVEECFRGVPSGH